jgi:23S rRNA (uracil1939-C5)-methyltransferase
MRQAQGNFQAEAKVRDLAIARVGAQGDGVSTPADETSPIYAPFTLPGERIRAEVKGDRAELLDLLEPSPERVPAPCPHFGACGGCALQHWAPCPYLEWKRGLIVEALAREQIETEVLEPFAARPGSRRRLALHARPGPRSDEARLGYKARGSWRLVEVDACPIADPRLVAAFPALRRLAAAVLEHPRSAPTLHATWTETGLDIDITGVERRTGGLSADRRMAAAEAAGAGDLARVTLSGEILYQARRPAVRQGRALVALPPGAFLQASAEAEAAMAGFAAEALAGAARIADLFSGVGTFALRLAETCQVHAADASAEAVAALVQAQASAAGLKRITADARDLFRRPVLAQELKGLDGAVFDPPRAGAQSQAAELAASRLGRVVGVSCNPATFARDARVLVDAGFRLERVLPVDQFLWSPHVELVGVFGR